VDVALLSRGDSVIIVGTGGFAFELGALLRRAGVAVRGCVGPNVPSAHTGLTYLGSDSVLQTMLDVPRIVAVGSPVVRRALFDRVEEAGGFLATYVDPAAYVAESVRIAHGSIVYPHATVHAGVTLSRGVLVNSNATIGHESQVGEFATIGPGASLGGRVRLERGVYVGIGASTIEGVTIAASSVLGAGAVVVRDCTECGTYVGVPARKTDI